MKNNWKSFLFLFIVVVVAGCVDPYDPVILSEDHNYLVVEGFLNSGGEASSIRLSRTARLADTSFIAVEPSATLTIESEGGEVFSFYEAEKGEYVLNPITLDSEDQYRLRIKTRDGNEYLSDLVPVKKTPPIDSVNWVYEENGVHLFVNTHDPQNNSWYYRWEFEETWEFNVPFQSYITVQGGDIFERPVPTPTNCWSFNNNTHLILGSSARLNEDRIFQQLITSIPRSSRRLSSRYSILVKQFALSREAFDYYRQMKKNSEQMGSFFDPQPVNLNGNIQSLNSPDEPVIGFFSIGSVQRERVFITRDDVMNPLWGYRMDCELVEVQADNLEAYVPLYLGLGGVIVATNVPCVDCSRGGSPVKPDFW